MYHTKETYIRQEQLLLPGLLHLASKTKSAVYLYMQYAIYEHCQKISCLFVQALGTGTKANL